jgi:hypothetical protein
MPMDMDDEQFTTPRMISSTTSEKSKERMALLAAERARVLFACYRRGDANDPERYVMAIATILMSYSEEIINDVTDPRTGISTREKFRAFPPNSGELKAYCDERDAYLTRINTYRRLPPRRALPPPSADKPPGRLANVLVPRNAPQYEKMVERSKTADPAEWCWHDRGIKVALTWLQ